MLQEWTDLIGQNIHDKYILRRFLRQDGQIALFEAEPKSLVRLLPAEGPGASLQERRWALALPLRHPNVQRMFDTGRWNDFVYAISELPDDELATVLAERPLELDEAAPVVDAIIGGLGYLHAHGLIHGAMKPESIVAIGDDARLTTHTLARADGSGRDLADDLEGLGHTIQAMLQGGIAGTRYESVANGLISGGWTLADARNALAAGGAAIPGSSVVSTPAAAGPSQLENDVSPEAAAVPSVPETEERPVLRTTWKGIAVAASALVVIIAAVTMMRPKPAAAPPPSAAVQESRPPVASPARRAEAAPQARTRRDAIPSPGNDRWAVVAAIYKDQAAAEKRASQMRAKWPGFEPRVVSGSRNMVVLGTGLTKAAADSLKKKARAAGFPRDVYVTKLDRQ